MNTLVMVEMVYNIMVRNENEWEGYVPSEELYYGPQSILQWADDLTYDYACNGEPTYLEEVPAEGPFAGLQRLADLMGGYRSDFKITFELPPLERITCCDVDW